LDHHECEKESKYAIVVNNQLSSDYSNKSLVGSGIVYKFIQALDSKLGINIADFYLDLVAIGLIADMADTRNTETRYYINKGLSNICNSFLQSLIDKQSYSLKGEVTTVGVQFYIAPLINACIRSGSMEEKLQMMNAFLESKELIYYERKKEYETIQVSTARLLGNIKNRQAKLRDKGLELIEEKIIEKNLLDNKILIVNITDILDKNLTGLVANGLAKKYKRGTLLLRFNEENGTLSGSIRGYDKGYIKDFKKFLLDTGKFIFVEGHSNAAGCSIDTENLISVNELINEQLKDVEIDVDIHEVDFIIPAKQLKERFIKELSKYKYLWGMNVEEPLVAIKDIEVNKNEVYLNGKTSKLIKFIYNGIEFIKFFSNEEEWESIINKGERLVIDVVGKCSINEYKGEKKPQVVIDDYEVTKVKKKEYVF
jgi:single-stranded-DNA-specific exonuclease